MMIEQMKPSGVDYLGDIPATWTAKRFKYCAQICNGGEYADIEIDEGGYPVIGSGGEFARASKYCYQGESVLLGRKGTIDKPLYVNDAFWCVDTMFYTKAKLNMVPKFLYYCALCFRFDYYVTSTALPSMTQKDLGSEMIAVPPTHEQKLIASFLDAQCSKLDSIIADLEKQIDTLQKYKKSLITETVTKGLDKSVPMKDSGIEWVGEIPNHWVKTRLKYCVETIGSGTTPDSGNPMYYEGGEFPWIQSGDLYNTDYIYSTEKQLTVLATKESKALNWYCKDFVVVAMYGASVGNVSISKIDAYTNQACCVIKLKKGNDNRYLFYFLKAAQEEMLLKAFGGTQPNISQAIIKNLNYLNVPYDEQKTIAEYLDEKLKAINECILEKNRQLQSIKEYRKSLIYEYVTGKKRVMEVK